MNLRSSFLRLVAASLLVGVCLLGLWQAGVIFPDPVTPEVDQISLAASNANLVTPTLGVNEVGLEEGKLAPDFEFSAFDGRRLRLSDFRGKAVFINFWATWCGPCRTEMPNMDSLLKLYGDKGLVIIGVNNGEQLAPARRFIDKLDVSFTVFAYDPNGDIARRYAIYGMPTSYFIDKEGVITRVSTGQLSFNLMESAAKEALAGYAAIAP